MTLGFPTGYSEIKLNITSEAMRGSLHQPDGEGL